MREVGSAIRPDTDDGLTLIKTALVMWDEVVVSLVETEVGVVVLNLVVVVVVAEGMVEEVEGYSDSLEGPASIEAATKRITFCVKSLYTFVVAFVLPPQNTFTLAVHQKETIHAHAGGKGKGHAWSAPCTDSRRSEDRCQLTSSSGELAVLEVLGGHLGEVVVALGLPIEAEVGGGVVDVRRE